MLFFFFFTVQSSFGPFIYSLLELQFLGMWSFPQGCYLIFTCSCSYYDPYRGVIVYFRVIDGSIKKGDRIYFMASKKVIHHSPILLPTCIIYSPLLLEIAEHASNTNLYVRYKLFSPFSFKSNFIVYRRITLLMKLEFYLPISCKWKNCILVK